MNKIWTILLLISVVAIICLTLYFFMPLLDGIVMGIVFAYVAKPIKRRLEPIGKIKASALATIVVIVPISVLIFYGLFHGLNQAIYLFTHYQIIESGLLDLLKKFGV